MGITQFTDGDDTTIKDADGDVLDLTSDGLIQSEVRFSQAAFADLSKIRVLLEHLLLEMRTLNLNINEAFELERGPGK